MRRQVIKLHTG